MRRSRDGGRPGPFTDGGPLLGGGVLRVREIAEARRKLACNTRSRSARSTRDLLRTRTHFAQLIFL